MSVTWARTAADPAHIVRYVVDLEPLIRRVATVERDVRLPVEEVAVPEDGPGGPNRVWCFGTFGPTMGRVGALVMVLVAMVVVTVVSFAVHRAMRLESFLAPGSPARDPQAAAAHALVIPDGRTLEEYVQAGLVDLRIMLVQAARRRPK